MVVTAPFKADVASGVAVYRPPGVLGGDGRRKPGPQLSWSSLLRFVNLTGPPSLLKMDCEGCEYEAPPS